VSDGLRSSALSAVHHEKQPVTVRSVLEDVLEREQLIMLMISSNLSSKSESSPTLCL
jgi:hypothetical protein